MVGKAGGLGLSKTVDWSMARNRACVPVCLTVAGDLAVRGNPAFLERSREHKGPLFSYCGSRLAPPVCPSKAKQARTTLL
jgi:hypothetical protein